MTSSSPPPSMLQKVRALLAKAEATEFAEEAEAFTAKAQELMAAHAIEQAMVDTSQPGNAAPESRTITIPNPYVKPKFVLLDEVARTNRCRAVMTQTRQGAQGIIVGFASDLAIVETLYTSLLLQATRCMAAEGSQVTAWGQSRTKSFRASFITAFAVEIGRRFAANRAVAETTAAQTHGTSVLPMLVARDGDVDAAVTQQFPQLGKLHVSVSNERGVQAGLEAGRTADIGTTRVGENDRRALAG